MTSVANFNSTALSNVNLVTKWIAENWDSTVKEVMTLATWQYAGFNPPFAQVEEAFLANDGDVENTLKHIAPRPVRHWFAANICLSNNG